MNKERQMKQKRKVGLKCKKKRRIKKLGKRKKMKVYGIENDKRKKRE